MSFLYNQFVAETVKHWVDISGIIDEDDTAKDSVNPVVVHVAPVGLAVASAEVNVAEVRIGGPLVKIGHAISVKLSAGAADVEYTVYFEFDTTGGSRRITKTPLVIKVKATPS